MDRVSRRFFKPVVTSQADFHAASPSEWQLACRREAVIRPLAEADGLSSLQVDRAAKNSWSRPQCYLPAYRPLQATAADFHLALGQSGPLPQVSGAAESTD